MKEKIIFVFILIILFSSQVLSENNEKSEIIKKQISSLEQIFGNTFYEAIYSIDELRPYSIIQIDKIVAMYDNNWIAPNEYVALLTGKDKILLSNKIIDFISDLESIELRNNILSKLKLWCVSENQINLISKKIGIGRANVLNIVMTFLPAPINSNTGEIISTEKSGSNEDYYYYSTINQLSNMTEKEQFSLFSKIFGELAQN